MQVKGSRASCFSEEKLFLLPLPAHPFELAVWKVATVQHNYYISVERMNYSVPYEYIKQKVDVRLTRTTVEVFFSGVRIASHLRLHGRPNQYSTVEGHMPPEHQAYLQWNGARFIRWAEQIGPHTAAVVRLFLTSYKVEQQGYEVLHGAAEVIRSVYLRTFGGRMSEGALFHIFPQFEKYPSCFEIRSGCASSRRSSGAKRGFQSP